MSPVGGEGMVPEFMAGLNSVPRMGRRSMNPFMRSALGGGGSTSTNSGGFRFLNSRPRRRSGPYNPFGGGFPAFRFVGGPGLYQVGTKYRVLIFLIQFSNSAQSYNQTIHFIDYF